MSFTYYEYLILLKEKVEQIRKSYYYEYGEAYDINKLTEGPANFRFHQKEKTIKRNIEKEKNKSKSKKLENIPERKEEDEEDK